MHSARTYESARSHERQPWAGLPAARSARSDTVAAARVTPTLLECGASAYARIVSRIEQSRRHIVVRCFDWRDDDSGDLIGRAVLRAAERGVRVDIYKDLVGASYEHFEAGKHSFFHKEIGAKSRFEVWFLRMVYRQGGPRKQERSELAEAILGHPRITVHHDRRRFDHSKVYIFDDQRMILGGMGIGDDFQLRNIDFMVELDCREAVSRYHARNHGSACFDPSRRLDFMLHNRSIDGRRGGSLLGDRLALIDGAERSLSIEMAYLGDRRFTEALIRAVARGVQVKLLAPERANVLASLNRACCDEILRRTGAPRNLRILLHPRMVHGKVMVVDHAIVEIGSANFTPISHGTYEEVDLYLRDHEFARIVEAAIERHSAGAAVYGARIPYNRVYQLFERSIVAYQARNGQRAPRA
ncbi:MAG: phosphatidylserine/phosphatidylglycerophosphate/cardiolipin synthase family protein [Proteobacteria bacterium]|nr:phosphatidylserine/phosphatidylglycerophosphate/cardiolipin synthase family protein [Pseudomonadota bacterium]